MELELQEARIKRRIKLRRLGTILVIIGMLIAFLVNGIVKPKRRERLISAELQRAKTYTVFSDEDYEVNNCSNVKFLAYFLRDVDDDGNLDKIAGTATELGKDDTLHFDLKVEGGKLKNGKIAINANNFYLQMSSVKDSIIAKDLIGNQITQIELNDIEANTEVEKSIVGRVRSGDYSYSYTKLAALEENINKYSDLENKIILTGTFEDSEGHETEIEKEITLAMDWYGITTTTYGDMNNIHNDLESRINTNAGTADFDIEIVTEENSKELYISKNHVEGTIPQLNGYDPILVVCNDSNSSFTYDKNTRNFVIERKAETDTNGVITNKVANQNTYDLTIRYSSQAVEANGGKPIYISIPVSEFYEGYNNPNDEFENPYVSSNARTTIKAIFDYAHDENIRLNTYIGEFVKSPYNNYIISKEKVDNLYNGKSAEESEDYYEEEWSLYTGNINPEDRVELNQEGTKFVKDEELDATNYVSNVGIYFDADENILTENGEIKVYNKLDGILLLTVNESNLTQYYDENPFLFGENIDTIKIEISGVNKSSYLNMHLVKELKDNKIFKNLDRETFEEINKIRTRVTGKVGTIDIETSSQDALYVSTSSVAKLEVNKNIINTNDVNNVEFKIIVDSEGKRYEKPWKNGYFLIKLPEEVVDYKLNSVTIDNRDMDIALSGIQEINGSKFIRVSASNSLDEVRSFIITANADISINPETSTRNTTYDLFYKNTIGQTYFGGVADEFDVNANSDVTEIIGKASVGVEIVPKNTLSITQSISNVDGSSEKIAPSIFDVERSTNSTRIKINIRAKNTFSGNAENVVMIGKVPYEGNKSFVNGNDLGSEFTTFMVGAITSTNENVNIYYTDKENPTEEIANQENGWKAAESVSNWNNIKSFMIVPNLPVASGEILSFSYEVDVPANAQICKKAYAYVMANFNLVAEGGIYKTKEEAKLAGIEVNKKFALNIEKYNEGKTELLDGASFAVIKINGEGKVVNQYLYATKNGGKIQENILEGIYRYNIMELSSPEGYSSNAPITLFEVKEDETNGLIIDNVMGPEADDYTIGNDGITFKYENTSTVKAKIVRKDDDDNPVVGAKLRISGANFGDLGKVFTSDSNGVTEISGIEPGRRYKITDEIADGYYLFEEFDFRVNNIDGVYTVSIINNDEISGSIITEDGSKKALIDVINFKEEIGTVTIKNISSKTGEALAGAKFKVYRNGEEIGTYITDENGKFEITGIYKNSFFSSNASYYEVKQIKAHDGYSTLKEFEFSLESRFSGDMVSIISGMNEFIDLGDTSTELVVMNSPYFKLIKKDYEGNRLSGIKFAIYDIEETTRFARDSKGEIIGNKEKINGIEYYLVETDNNGEILVDLPQGKYKAVEVVADEKYDISKSTYYFSVGSSTEGTETLGIKDYYVMSSDADEYVNNIEKTRDDGYVVSGTYSNKSIKIDGTTYENKGEKDSFIIKYDESDNVKWSKVISAAGIEEIIGIKELSDGSIIAIGNYKDVENLTLGSFELSNSDKKSNVFIIKYDANGNIIFAKEINGTKDVYANKITLSQDNRIVIAGTSEEELTIDGITIGNAGGKDGFYLEIDYSGTAISGKNFGGNGSEAIKEAIKTPDGSIIFVGTYTSTNLVINADTLPYEGYEDAIIAKISSLGEYTWYKTVNTELQDEANSIVVDSTGNYIIGLVIDSTSESVEIDGEYIELNASTDIILLIYNGAGELQKVSTILGNGSDFLERLKIDNTDRVFAIGNTYSGIIDADQIIELYNSNPMYTDGFVICYDKDLTNPHGIEIGGDASDEITDITVNNNNEIIAVGYLEENGIINDDRINTNGVDSYAVYLERKSVANIEAETIIDVGTEENEEEYAICKTNDGGFLVIGGYTGNSLKLGSVTLNRAGTGNRFQLYVAKYNQEGNVIKAANIDNPNIMSVEALVETNDGGFILGTYSGMAKYDKNFNEVWSRNTDYEVLQVFSDDEGAYIGAKYVMQEDTTMKVTVKKFSSLGETEWQGEFSDVYDLRALQTSHNDFYVITDNTLYKYDISGNLILTKELGDLVRIKAISETDDGGIIFAGEFEGDVTFSNFNLKNNGYIDGIIVKYDNTNSVDWALNCGSYDEDAFRGITELIDGTYVAIGRTYSSEFNAGDNGTDTSGGEDGIILKLSNVYGSENISELNVSNILKKFNITTNVKENSDGIKGGSISGEKSKVYEVVSYGNNSTKEIVITPDTGYELIGITVNGEEFPFELNGNETSYRMPLFTDVKEDKEIQAEFSLETNKVIINKVDATTGTPLPNAELRLDQLEERESPVNVVGAMVDNSRQYVVPDKEHEVFDVFGELTSDGEYYFTPYEGADGIVPTNGLWYLRAAINKYTTRGIQDSEAKSYVEIDLTNYSGDYAVVVEATASSHRWDYGYATITDSEDTVSINDTEGQFMNISGLIPRTEYVSDLLEGGHKYYLHFGYLKDEAMDGNDDQVVINNVTVYEAEGITYGFTQNIDGDYESTNVGKDKTTANGYVKVDLTDYQGKYNLFVKARISSEYVDFGYAVVTETTDRVNYNDETYTKFIDISGEDEEDKEYVTVVEGGKIYYVHFGYCKNDSVSEGDDKLIIKDIYLTPNASDLYHIDLRTNSNGQAVAQIPYGKYSVTETLAPAGYFLNTNGMVIEFRDNNLDNHEYTITDEKKAKVVVHHYLYGTDTKVAEDDIVEGKIGLDYTTSPNLDLPAYELIKNNSNEYILPSNNTGTFTLEDQEVTYYYSDKKIALIVHHYIEGTTQGVPLADGTVAKDQISYGDKDDPYTTNYIADNLLDEKYELSREPNNKEGVLSGTEVEVTYFYRVARRTITVEVLYQDDNTPIEGASFEINGNTYTSNENGLISITLPIGEYEVVQTATGNKYDIKEDIDDIIITKDSEGDKVTIYNNAAKGTVTVHYLELDKDTGVPLKDGTLAEPIVKTGKIGDIYITSPLEEVSDDYTLYEMPDNVNGLYTRENIDVYYYYIASNCSYTVNYLDYVSGNPIKDAKVVSGVIYKTVVNTPNEIINIEGYNYYRADKDLIEVGNVPEENVINLYYVVMGDLEYTVNYLEVTTNKVLHEKKTYENISFGLEYPAEDEVIDIPGYNYTSSNVEVLTIGANSANNVINLYYSKRTDLKYTVNFLDVADGSSIHTPKVYTNISFETVIECAQEAIIVEGYNYDSVDKDSLTIGVKESDNVINVYYEKRHDLSYTVNFYEKDTTTKVRESIVYENIEFGTKIVSTREILDLHGLDFYSVTADIIVGVDEEQNVINIYYIRQNGIDYTVHYVEKATNRQLRDDKLVENQLFGIEILPENEYVEIDGYEYDSGDKDKLVLDTDTVNEITVYYRKRSDLSYRIKYLEQDTDKVLLEEKLAENQVFGSKVVAIEEARLVSIEGYEYSYADKQEITIVTDETRNIITLYFKKLSNLTYVVNYLDINEPTKLLHSSKVVNDQTYLTEILPDDEIIQITGYNYTSADKDRLIISANNSENVLNLYYTRKNDLGYTVYYRNIETDELIHETKVVENQLYQTIIYASDEAIDIPGYEFKRASKDQITIGVLEDTNIITLYYQRIKGRIIVNHVDKLTGEAVAPQEILTPYVGEGYTCSAAILSDYKLIDYTPNYTGVVEAEETIVYFYYRELTYVIVQYMDMNTNTRLQDDIVHEYMVGENFSIRSDEKQLTGYELVEYPEVMAGTTTKNDLTLVFKYAKRTSVIIRYVNRLTNTELMTNGGIYGYVGKPYHAEKQVIPNYVYVDSTGNADGVMTEDEIEVIFYYDEFSGGVLEQHIDETSGELLSNTLYTGVVGDSYQILPMSFAGYKLDRYNLPDKTTGQMEEEPITVTYYYLKNATLTINYVDKYTAGKIADTIYYQGYTGDMYSIDEFKKNIPGYTLVSAPNGPFGTFDHNNNEITFYYQKNTEVRVRYMEVDTDNVLAEELIEGYVSQEYSTQLREFDGYNFYYASDNIMGVMTSNTIEVTYYYLKETYLTVKFINKNTGDEIAESIVYKGLTGDYYNVTTDEKVIPGFTLTQTPEEISGRLKRDPMTLIFYYKKNAKVTVKFVDKFSGEEVEERIVLQGLSGNNYNSEQKVIEGYTCVGNSGNTYGQYEDFDKEVIFYYAKNARIKVMYVDMNSGNKLDQDEYPSFIGDTYETVLKDFDGYLFINSDGILNGTTTEVNYTVTYYYALKSKVIAKYVDKRTGENIIDPIVIEGYESKPYTTELKEFNGYELAEKPVITEGRMEDEDITITYTYYHIAGDITERHYDIKTGKILYEEVHSGYVGDNYSFISRDIEGYDVVEDKLPKNSSGQMTTDSEKVEFYYIRNTTLRVQYLDEDGNKIFKDAVKNGHEGDIYNVEKMLISGYNLEKEPENSKGTLNVTYNADGTVTTETVVQFRYKKVSSDTSTADGKSETSVIPATLDYNQTVIVIAILAIITTAYGTFNGKKLIKVYADIRQYNRENRSNTNNVDITNGWENDKKKKKIDIDLKGTFNKIKDSKIVNKIKTIDLMKPIKDMKARKKIETEEKQEYSSEEERINAIVEKEKQEFLDRIKYKKD